MYTYIEIRQWTHTFLPEQLGRLRLETDHEFENDCESVEFDRYGDECKSCKEMNLQTAIQKLNSLAELTLESKPKSTKVGHQVWSVPWRQVFLALVAKDSIVAC